MGASLTNLRFCSHTRRTVQGASSVVDASVARSPTWDDKRVLKSALVLHSLDPTLLQQTTKRFVFLNMSNLDKLVEAQKNGEVLGLKGL